MATLLLLACNPPDHKNRQGELLSINGTELFVRHVGDGDPVLVVHGGPVLEHGYLLPHLEPLADAYELIFYDQRLSGRSSSAVDSASVRLATFVEDIEILRQTLGLGRFHLLAHSWGGLLAMHYAIRYGEHLRSLTLLNPMSPTASMWREEEAAVSMLVTDADRREMQAIRETSAFQRMEPAAVAAMLRASYSVQFHARGEARKLELYVPTDYAERSRQFGYMMPDLMTFDLLDDLTRVTVPTLIIYGDAEPAASISGPALETALPNAELLVVREAGHFPFIEQPAATLSALREFLRARSER